MVAILREMMFPCGFDKTLVITGFDVMFKTSDKNTAVIYYTFTNEHERVVWLFLS